MLSSKECAQCHSKLSIDCFTKNVNQIDKMNPVCRECVSYRYHQRYKIKSNIRSAARYIEYMTFLANYFSDKCCANCGESNPHTFEFHHLDESKKEFTLGGSHMRNWDKILNEISKCVILCVNCHRKVHHSGLVLNLNC